MHTSSRYSGHVLVSAPHLGDPNFHRTVVLVASHDDDGALGLILNRPTDIAVLDLLEPWAASICEPAIAFQGGPVQPEVAIGLGRLRAGSMAPSADAWTVISERVGLLDLGTDATTVVDRFESIRVFSGYAGWGPGQLESEVAQSDWFVVPFHPDDPFRAPVDDMWRMVLRRQPGRLALFSDFPDEPRWN